MGSLWPASKIFSGVYPFIFSILQYFNMQFCVFFPKNGFLFPIIAVLLQPKTKQKGFRAYIDTLQTAPTSGEHCPRPYI